MSSQRRAGIAQPPALTTSLGGLSYQGFGAGSSSAYGSAPNSTTLLSSPFSQHNPANLGRLSGISGMDAPAMTMRQSPGHTVPYNPLEWSSRGTSPRLGAGAQQGRASPQAYSDGESLSITFEHQNLHGRKTKESCILFDFDIRGSWFRCEPGDWDEPNVATLRLVAVK